jgi:hypothetical protein
LPEEFKDPSAVFALDEGGEEARALISPRGAQTPEFPAPLPVPPPVNGVRLPPSQSAQASRSPDRFISAAPTPTPVPAGRCPAQPTEVVLRKRTRPPEGRLVAARAHLSEAERFPWNHVIDKILKIKWWSRFSSKKSVAGTGS